MMGYLHTIKKKGLLNLPGISNATKLLTEDLLLKDAEKHHCFFRQAGLHNHLSHHVLAAYDMGAAPGLIQKIYDVHASYQRPIILNDSDKGIVINQGNWAAYLGKQEAYGAFFRFFCQEIEKDGVASVLGRYLFEEEANVDGKKMLIRFVGGALHPFIQVGYGLEFGNNILIATGLAQTAVHSAQTADIFPPPSLRGKKSEIRNSGPGRQPIQGPSLLEALRQICDSKVLVPPPYNPDALFSERVRSATEGTKALEIRKICESYTLTILDDVSDEELQDRVEEIIWASTLLMFATGREGREHRLDFFLMHLVTSSLFLQPILEAVPVNKMKWKVDLIRSFVPVLVVIMLARGRPTIRADLVKQWKETPRPSEWKEILGLGIGKENESSIGKLGNDEDYNSWPTLIQGALHHPDMHAIKAMRSLVHAAQKYGEIQPGGAIGAFRQVQKEGSVGLGEIKMEETFKGMGEVDGTLFVRAAGVMMDYIGWTISGQPGRPDWDRSALGYDEAWENKN